MDRAEFDRVADEYLEMHARSIAASGESPEYFARYKVEDVAEMARQTGHEVRSVIDFGSGVGNSIPHFADLFPAASLTCADVSKRSLEISRARFPLAKANFSEINGFRLPFEDGSFDLVFSACVFHHIPHDEHVGWISELRRITSRNGMLFIFEHNPMNPLTVAAVNGCPFDANAVLIRPSELKRRIETAGWAGARTVYRIFFPRALAPFRPLEKWMRRLPLGAQYFVTARNS
jgi:ubiquinone/menaquinone biosynthesis C-methylase UbiE